jgi:hypothetical protein
MNYGISWSPPCSKNWCDPQEMRTGETSDGNDAAGLKIHFIALLKILSL